MIVDQDINPHDTLYHWGAMFIKILKTTPEQQLDLIDFFLMVKKEYKDISMNVFSCTLNWLYLLGIVKSNKRGIVKCF